MPPCLSSSLSWAPLAQDSCASILFSSVRTWSHAVSCLGPAPRKGGKHAMHFLRLALLNMMLSGCIHFPANDVTCSLCWKCFLVHSSVDWQLDWFITQRLWIATVNIGVKCLCDVLTSSVFRKHPAGSHGVSVRVLLVRWNTLTKKQVERKGSVWLNASSHCLSLKEVRIGTQAGQEPGDRSWWPRRGAVYWFAPLG